MNLVESSNQVALTRLNSFPAWDAEEYGLQGSTEWVQQYSTLLDHRGVAYFNLDVIMGNESLLVEAMPTLYRTTVLAAKRVPNPNPQEYSAGRPTVYDTWLYKQPSDTISDVPQMPAPDGRSDHAAFFKYLGIPVLSFSYTNVTSVDITYPLYHTLYETLLLADMMDRNDFSFHVATGQFWAEMVRIVADTSLIPFNLTDYAIVLEKYTGQLNETLTKLELLPKKEQLLNADVQSLQTTLVEMKEASIKFHASTDRRELSLKDQEIINCRLQQVERCFINPRGGRPTRPDQRHIIFGLVQKNVYASSGLPFIYDQVDKYETAENDEARDEAYNSLREQISIVHYSVECVINLLKKTPGNAN